MSDFFPEGRIPGCLPRATAFGTCCPKAEDRIEVITDPDQYASLIGQISLNPYIRKRMDQGRIGSCATASTTGTVLLVREWNDRLFVDLNWLSIYCFTSDGKDRGSNIDRNLIHARDVGILPFSVWPTTTDWKTKPPQSLLDTEACKYRIDEFFDIGTIEEVMTALVLGYPVVFGWKGHSCVLIELKDMETAYYLNSWGADWGDNGVGEIKLREINFGYGAFAVRSVVDSGGA